APRTSPTSPSRWDSHGASERRRGRGWPPGRGTTTPSPAGHLEVGAMIETSDRPTTRDAGPVDFGALTSPIPNSTRVAGYGSAVLATVFSLTYVVGQLAEWMGWLGSQGGPESGST